MREYLKHCLVRALHAAPITYPVRDACFAWLRRQMNCDLVTSMSDGARLHVDITDYIGFRIWQRGGWEKRVRTLMSDLLCGGGVFVEIGAHCGYFATSMAHAFRDSVRVVAFEPNMLVARHILENIQLNSLDNLVLDRRAVSDHNGTATLYVQKEGNSGKSGMASRLGARCPVEVETVTLEAAFAHHRIEDVTLLKLDVEGAEALILPAMQPLLANGQIRALVLELHKNTETDFGVHQDRLLDMLTGNGFQLYDTEHPIKQAVPYRRPTVWTSNQHVCALKRDLI